MFIAFSPGNLDLKFFNRNLLEEMRNNCRISLTTPDGRNTRIFTSR
jgi:hypothetical protein